MKKDLDQIHNMAIVIKNSDSLSMKDINKFNI